MFLGRSVFSSHNLYELICWYDMYGFEYTLIRVALSAFLLFTLAFTINANQMVPATAASHKNIFTGDGQREVLLKICICLAS